jgi:hypothetical protein
VSPKTAPLIENAFFLWGKDVTTYSVLLIRQVFDNLTFTGATRRKLSTRWKLAAWADRMNSAGYGTAMPPMDDAAVFVHGGVNHMHCGGFAFDAPVDTIRLALRQAGLADLGLCYQAPRAERFVCESTSLTAAMQAIRGRAARRTAPFLKEGDGLAKLVDSAAAITGLSNGILLNWLRRQMRLLAEAAAFFDEAFQASPPRAVFTHGGLGPITAGVRVAAQKAGIAGFDIEHGGFSMWDPRRGGSKLKLFATGRHLVWMAYGGPDDCVTGSPSARLHRWLTTGLHPEAALLPESFRTAYRAGCDLAAAERAKSSLPLVLLAGHGSDSEKQMRDALRGELDACLIWHRAHPKDLPKKRATAGFSASHLPLGSILAQADWAVSAVSSLGIEAAAFGCGVRFLSEDGRALFPGIESPADQLRAFPTRPSRLPNATGDEALAAIIEGIRVLPVRPASRSPRN